MGTKTLVGCSVTPLVLTGVALAGLVWGTGTYVGLTRQEVRVEQAWSQMENAWLHREMLIPDLFELAREAGAAGDARFESWMAAADRAGGFVLTPELLDDETRFRAFLEAQRGLQAAVDELVADHGARLARRAPEVYSRMQDQLAAARLRLEEGRTRFNDRVAEYNDTISRYPRKLVAKVFDFRPRTPCVLREQDTAAVRADGAP